MTNYKICAKCVMDTSDPNISFDENGVCNHCLRYVSELPKRTFSGVDAQEKLATLVAAIKSSGIDNEYDCLIGVSGGVDSTYVAYIVKELGLRPLAVHFDNGWNSELAVSNIKKVLDKLNIDLVTYVIDWNEFKSLQLAFLKASTPDGEIPTDHAIMALLYREAANRDIRFIISGMNFATESISVPNWAYGHSDWKYIKAINARFGTGKLKSYLHYSFYMLAWWTFVKRIQTVSILNYLDYSKENAMCTLRDELGWQYYGGKHYESVYTRFYQGYVLPNKYGIDKRRMHLSDLINSGQMSRENALVELESNAYLDGGMHKDDMTYVIKKFGLSPDAFSQIMSLPNKTFHDYPNSYGFVVWLKRLVNFLRQHGRLAK